MEQSILKNTKKMLQIADDDPSFDLDVILHINSAFSDLHDLGVGPEAGFAIEDEDPVWTDFLADDDVKLNKVKTCIYLKVRLLFDPPQTPHLLTAANEQLAEKMWRLSVNREETGWSDPQPVVVIDGGDPTGP